MIINAGLPLAGGVRFSSGSYVGNGKSDSEYPTSVDVGFEPKAFCVLKGNTMAGAVGEEEFALWYEGLANLKSVAGSSTSFYRTVTVNGTKISWWASAASAQTAAARQFNTSGITYRWFALG